MLPSKTNLPVVLARIFFWIWFDMLNQKNHCSENIVLFAPQKERIITSKHCEDVGLGLAKSSQFGWQAFTNKMVRAVWVARVSRWVSRWSFWGGSLSLIIGGSGALPSFQGNTSWRYTHFFHWTMIGRKSICWDIYHLEWCFYEWSIKSSCCRC